MMLNGRPVTNITTTTLTNADFTAYGGATATSASANVPLFPGQWNFVAQYKVPAQTIVRVGASDPTGGSSQAGTPAYIRIDETSGTGQVSGAIRLVYKNAADQALAYFFSDSTGRWSASQTDRTLAKLLDRQDSAQIKEDSKLVIEINPTSLSGNATSGTVGFADADTLIRVPVTIYFLG